jgi:hypothetical protein
VTRTLILIAVQIERVGIATQIEGPDQAEPSLEAPVGLSLEAALSEPAPVIVTVYFQDARTSGQPWRQHEIQPRN